MEISQVLQSKSIKSKRHISMFKSPVQCTPVMWFLKVFFSIKLKNNDGADSFYFDQACWITEQLKNCWLGYQNFVLNTNYYHNYSIITIQVQNLLQLFNVPQIGYSATSKDLRWDIFLRFCNCCPFLIFYRIFWNVLISSNIF